MTKKLFNTVGMFALLLLASCTGCNRVEPNYKGVLMENYGRNGKSDFKPVTGTVGILGPGSELYQVPLFEQSADADPIKLGDNTGGFTVDPSYSYQVSPDKAVDVIFNYRHIGIDDDLLDNIEKATLNKLVVNAYREEARMFSADSLIRNMNKYEQAVDNRLSKEFLNKGFILNNITSGLTPPAGLNNAMNDRNKVKIETDKIKDQLAQAEMLQRKARIDAETNRIKATGLPKEVLAEKWIDAIRNSKNRIIITDGKTPIVLN